MRSSELIYREYKTHYIRQAADKQEKGRVYTHFSLIYALHPPLFMRRTSTTTIVARKTCWSIPYSFPAFLRGEKWCSIYRNTTYLSSTLFANFDSPNTFLASCLLRHVIDPTAAVRSAVAFLIGRDSSMLGFSRDNTHRTTSAVTLSFVLESTPTPPTDSSAFVYASHLNDHKCCHKNLLEPATSFSQNIANFTIPFFPHTPILYHNNFPPFSLLFPFYEHTYLLHIIP